MPVGQVGNLGPDLGVPSGPGPTRPRTANYASLRQPLSGRGSVCGIVQSRDRKGAVV